MSAFFHLARWLQSTAADLQFALPHFVLVSIPWSMLLVQFNFNFRIFPAVPPDQMLEVLEGATSTLKSFHHQILTSLWLQKHNVHGDAAFHRPLDFITHCHLGCLVNHVCSLKTLVGNMKLTQHTNGVRQATSSSSMLNPPTTNGLLAATSSSSNRTSRVSSSKLYSIRMSSGGHQQWYAGQPGSQNKYFRMLYHPVSELQVSDV